MIGYTISCFLLIVIVPGIASDEVDKLYSELFRKEWSSGAEHISREDVLGHLKTLAEAYRGNDDKKFELQQAEELIGLSQITVDKCKNEQLAELQTRKIEFDIYKVNIERFYDNFLAQQINKCKEHLSELVRKQVKSGWILNRSRKAASDIYSSTQMRSGPGEDLHQAVKKETLIKGLLHYLNKKCHEYHLKFRYEFTKQEFKRKIRSRFDGLCHKVQKNFDSTLTYFDTISIISKEFVYEFPLNWLASARICRLYLKEVESDLIDEAYKFWSKNKSDHVYRLC